MKSSSIDVVIPAFNAHRFILQAICSVDIQTLRPAQIIVVDDGSTDDTADLVTAHHGPVPIRLIRQTNRGPNAARNVGLGVCRGEWVAFLDADDEWLPAKLEKQMQVFRGTDMANLGVVYSDYLNIDEHGQPLDHLLRCRLDRKLRGHIFEQLLEANLVTGSASSVLIRRACFAAVGLFDENLRFGEDWDMWLRLAERYSYDYAEDCLVRIRQHAESAQAKIQNVPVSELPFFNKWAETLPPQVKCPRSWAGRIATCIVGRFPNMEYMTAVRSILSRQAKGRIFRKACGSLKLYVCLSLVYTCMVNIRRDANKTLALMSAVLRT